MSKTYEFTDEQVNNLKVCIQNMWTARQVTSEAIAQELIVLKRVLETCGKDAEPKK